MVTVISDVYFNVAVILSKGRRHQIIKIKLHFHINVKFTLHEIAIFSLEDILFGITRSIFFNPSRLLFQFYCRLTLPNHGGHTTA